MGRSRELAELASAYDSGSSMGFRNRIINGDMRIDQRNAGASVSIAAPGVDRYVLDRFLSVGAVTAGSRTVGRVSDGPSIGTPFCHSMTQAGANESTAAADYCMRQVIELQNIYDLAGKDVTVSFWYKSNRTGSHGVRLIGSYAAGSTGGADQQLTFTVNSANTWEYKTITFTALKNLTSWGTGASNAGGIILDIGFRCATFGQPAVSVNDYFRITEVQLEAGSVASPFERRDYGRELMMCQRYFEKSFPQSIAPNNNGTGVGQIMFALSWGGSQASKAPIRFAVVKRSVPTLTKYGDASANYAFLSNGNLPTTQQTYNYNSNINPEPITDAEFCLSNQATQSTLFCIYGGWTASAEL